MSSGKVALGLLAGVAVGALAGILFAPAKGSRTRRRIMKKGEDYTEVMKEKVNHLMDSANQKFEKVKKDVTDFTEKKMGKTENA
jgi:gas vesicle protein